MDTTGQPWMATYLWSAIMCLPFLGRLKLKFVILYQPFWDQFYTRITAERYAGQSGEPP